MNEYLDEVHHLTVPFPPHNAAIAFPETALGETERVYKRSRRGLALKPPLMMLSRRRTPERISQVMELAANRLLA